MDSLGFVHFGYMSLGGFVLFLGESFHTHARAGGGGREDGEGERESLAGSMPSTERDMGLYPTTSQNQGSDT